MNTISLIETAPDCDEPDFGQPAWLAKYGLPPQGQWTEEDYLRLNDCTNRMIELSDGCLEVLTMPTVLHQLILKYLFGHLDDFVSQHAAGLVLFAPLPVRLWQGKYREPDIIFFLPSRRLSLRGRPEGADLVVEIVSPDANSQARDLEIKRREYAKAGIGEYWIVDPELEQITVLVLEGQTYREHGNFSRGATASSVLLQGFAVAVSDVFDAAQIADEEKPH